ncbi:hypothetical protein BJY21_000397 [Kineosphaera limosa]|uniref:Uncharacterized protein n=1 Tax=Kineosphaera limosa NBRC 100340 TaxID=1184609 RepID=K6WGD5_9MICO|nr:hypothetical protein [Kineosphaera limosa]NYD99212.1 hypothetical protein [Kineosphaera limosa]GAB98330.1 hypothetical protein KILIM_128_00040 [Kineosphaera limosa NBRC 100340]
MSQHDDEAPETNGDTPEVPETPETPERSDASAGQPVAKGDGDDLGSAMKRLDEADPGDTQEVLEAGEQAHEELRARMDDSSGDTAGDSGR